jgi:CRISPR/Cas system CSM-associated protein Csm3 (group 7 of RAMP superfamily)
MKYTHRYIARIILEAETALFVGSGETSLLKDALVQKDHLGFPMIQGTSLKGVLRHALEYHAIEVEKDKWNKFFGFQKDDKGVGSKVKISSAYFLLSNKQVAEGYDATHQEVLQQFKDLPSRQHVRITHHGVADSEKGGLFENEVVHKGCKFIFEMEVKGDGSETTQWNELLSQLKNPLFRIGQGTRNGYGKLKVISCKKKEFNLNLKDENDYQAYLKFDPSFNEPNKCLIEEKETINYSGTALTHYQLELTPDAFFIFGSGYGDDEVDNQPFKEEVLVYNEAAKKIEFKEYTVIPASSIKGAISHRTCFHFNKTQKVFADKLDAILHKDNVGKNNLAVALLFGVGAGEETKEPSRGKVIINDLYLNEEEIRNDKILNHVAIDRFTGGALDGALFSERVSQLKNKKSIELNIWVEQNKIEKEVLGAFEKTLEDICKGLLPLGGMTTKGHGIFTGKLIKNKTEILFDYDDEN